MKRAIEMKILLTSSGKTIEWHFNPRCLPLLITVFPSSVSIKIWENALFMISFPEDKNISPIRCYKNKLFTALHAYRKCSSHGYLPLLFLVPVHFPTRL